MAFDGLLSAYVCFLKMAREERGTGEGTEGVEEERWPPEGHAGNRAGTSTTPSIHPNLQWIVFNKCQHPCLASGLPLHAPTSGQLVPEKFMMQSEQRLWAAVSQIQGYKAEGGRD